MTDTLLAKLERTRKGFAAECRWHRFLVDAYTGCGGFESTEIQQPMTGYWGAGAEIYAATAGALGVNGVDLSLTYLDRYPREDTPKFEARKRVANYLNYVEPLTDLKISYMLRKPFTRQNEPEKVAAWRQNIDGVGTRWDDMRPTIAVNTALVGWAPLLIDRPEADPGTSKAQAQQLQLDTYIVRQLAPANLLEWEERDGRFLWVKVRTSRTELHSWDGDPVQIDEYSIWYPDHVVRYEVRRPAGKEPIVSAAMVISHGFKRVPIAVFRHKRMPTHVSCVMGMPMHAQVSRVARRLFNLTSEFDEHIRSQVFAILVLAGMAPTIQGGELTIGTSNSVPLDPMATQKHYYLAPPADVAATLEKRSESTIQEMFRMGRTEFTRPSGGVTSAESRMYEFAQTNRAIADYAGEFARGETDVAQIVGAAENVSDDELDKYATVAPTDFDVEDLVADLESAADALAMNLGPTATKAIKQRVVDRVLPQLPPDLRKAVEKDLDEAAKAPPPAPIVLPKGALPSAPPGVPTP